LTTFAPRPHLAVPPPHTAPSISPLDDLRVEDWEEMIDINIKGVL